MGLGSQNLRSSLLTFAQVCLTTCPNPDKSGVYVSCKFCRVSFAAYLGDSLRPASVADLAYSKTFNQQSYQQLLWKTQANGKIIGGRNSSARFYAGGSHMTFKLVRSMDNLQLICASASGDFSPMISDHILLRPILVRGNYLMIMSNFEIIASVSKSQNSKHQN